MSTNNDSKKTQIELEAIANRMSRMSKSLDYLYEAADSQNDHIAGILFSLCNEAFEAHEKLKSLAEKLADSDEDQDKNALAEADYDEIRAMIRRRKQASGEAPPIEFELTADQFSDLAIAAKQAGQSVDDFASRLVSDHLKRWLDEPATA